MWPVLIHFAFFVVIYGVKTSAGKTERSGMYFVERLGESWCVPDGYIHVMAWMARGRPPNILTSDTFNNLLICSGFLPSESRGLEWIRKQITWWQVSPWQKHCNLTNHHQLMQVFDYNYPIVINDRHACFNQHM